LGTFYGLTTPPAGTALELVSTSGNPERGGLLTLGSVLGSHAHSMETSPVKRGVFVRERLLCQELPDPPINVDTTPPGLDPTLTTRERFAKHTADAACTPCHALIDPIGFGFETYDGVGAYRTEENGLPVDDSGEVTELETGSADSVSFSGPQQLADMLAASPTAQACLATQYMRFVRGFVEPHGDICVADVAEQFVASLSLQELLASVVKDQSFSVKAKTEDAP
jgi:hypothetical protein